MYVVGWKDWELNLNELNWKMRLVCVLSLSVMFWKLHTVVYKSLRLDKKEPQNELSLYSCLPTPCPDIFSQCCAVVTGSQKPRRCPRCWRETCCSFDLSLSSRQHQLSSTSLKQLKEMLFSVISVHLWDFYVLLLQVLHLFLLIHKSVFGEITSLHWSAQACLWKTGKIISLICCTT